MKLRDAQAFIPGWNIFYMLKEHNRSEREWAQRQQAYQATAEQGKRDMAQVQEWARQRDALRTQGRHDQADALDRRIAGMAQSYIDRIA